MTMSECAATLREARIVSEIERVLTESGEREQLATFDATKWVRAWIGEPVPALGGLTPLHFMGSTTGLETVLQLVRQMQSGAFA